MKDKINKSEAMSAKNSTSRIQEKEINDEKSLATVVLCLLAGLVGLSFGCTSSNEIKLAVNEQGETAPKNLIEFIDNAGWCWFQDERAIMHYGGRGGMSRSLAHQTIKYFVAKVIEERWFSALELKSWKLDISMI